MSSNSKEIIEQLRCLRKESGINRHAFADLTGYNPTQIYRYETGKRTPKLDTIFDMANALGYEIVLKPKD